MPHQGSTLVLHARHGDSISTSGRRGRAYSRGGGTIFKLANHLVGRLAELERLDDALDALSTGRAGAIEIVGAAGIGKTRLLAELAARADARGHIVLSGSGAEFERDLPFGVFVDALDEYLESVDPRRLGRLGEHVRNELAHVFPSFPDPGRGNVSGVQGERYRTNRAARELLERLAATKPMVLILDDFHWADAASIDLVSSLLSRPPAAAVLLVLGARPTPGPSRLTNALERALRAGEMARVELHPLTSDEAAALLGVERPDPSTAALYADSGGNPFYLEQLARAPHQAPPDSPNRDLSVPSVHVPPMVAAAMMEELSLLNSSSRRVLEGASVVGDPFEPELAAAAADVSEEQAIEAIDELLVAELVRPTTVPRRFRFRHPIVRRAVYEAAPGGWRLTAHRRAAEALASRGATAAARAHHIDVSAKVGDAAAVSTLTAAGRQSAQRAPATAARWFTGALRLLSDTAPPGERVELLLANATALAATGRFAPAHEALLESLAMLPEEATARRLELSAICARVEHLLGRHDQAHARLTAALDGLADAGGPDAVALMIELAGDANFRLDFESGQDWATRAVSAARPLADPGLTAAALALLARALAWGGDAKRGEAVRSEAATLLDALSDDQLAHRLAAAVDLSSAEIYLDRFTEAGVHAQRALAVGRATGQAQLFPGVYAGLGVAWCMLGRLAEAAELLDAATEAARLSGTPQALAWALFCRAFVAFPAGDTRTAIAAAQESLEIAADAGHDVIAARAAAVLGVALLDAGEPARAAEALTGPVGEHFASIPIAWRAYFLELMTRYWLGVGHRADAERAAAGAQVSASAVGLRLPTAMAHRAAAAIALDLGDAPTAVELALASAALADDVGAPIEAGLSRTVAGRALAHLGQRDEAVGLLQQAATELGSCGALRYRDAAEQELRQLGRHIHRRTRPGAPNQGGVASLTERELQIAMLIVDRKTNAEIAGQLFLSKKTIETHIRNMFRKLDADSRVEIARAVERAESLTN
jgi:DNA-binding CsgD family transcriptional regulator